MGEYEYRCLNGHLTTKSIPIRDYTPGPITCPECGGVAERELSAIKTTFHHADRKAIKRSGR